MKINKVIEQGPRLLVFIEGQENPRIVAKLGIKTKADLIEALKPKGEKRRTELED